jgi:hypothetical protein
MTEELVSLSERGGSVFAYVTAGLVLPDELNRVCLASEVISAHI